MKNLRTTLQEVVRVMKEAPYEDYSQEYSEKDFEKEYRILQHKLNNWRNGRKRKYALLTGVFFGLSTFSGFDMDVIAEQYRGTTIGNIAVIMLCCFIGILSAIIVSSVIEYYKNSLRTKIMEYEVYYIQDKVQDDVFENSIKMSYKYLDQYYLQTREQARKGFFVTVCVSIFGAILIGIGIMAMFLGKIEPSYITCASGVITEFIAAVFFYLYNKTVVSMSKYHNKLVLSHNISIALKVADTLPDDDKTDSKKIIISELLKDINTYLIKSDSDDKGSKSE